MSQIAQYSFTQSSSISQMQACYREGGHLRGGFIERDGILETVPKTPAYVFGERIVEPLLRRVGGLLLKFDEAFTRAISFLPVVKADDTGLIGWFDGECPEGWTEYTKLEGRVVIGAGTYDGIAQDGRKEVVSYSVGEKGGERAHVLTLDEMPKHNHQASQSGGAVAPGPSHAHYSQRHTNLVARVKWLDEGNNKEHNNMQPYLVLKSCKKTSINKVDSKKLFSNFESSGEKLRQQQEVGLSSIKAEVTLFKEECSLALKKSKAEWEELHQQQEVELSSIKQGVLIAGTTLLAAAVFLCLNVYARGA